MNFIQTKVNQFARRDFTIKNTAESMSYCLALILATERVMTVRKKSKKGRMADA